VWQVLPGLLGAALVELALRLVTPPNLALTSQANPYSLPGHIVWNTMFVLVAISLGFVVGLIVGASTTRNS